MKIKTILMMFLMISVLWGGLILVISLAIKKEKNNDKS